VTPCPRTADHPSLAAWAKACHGWALEPTVQAWLEGWGYQDYWTGRAGIVRDRISSKQARTEQPRARLVRRGRWRKSEARLNQRKQ